MNDLNEKLSHYKLTENSIEKINHYLNTLSAEDCWQKISTEILTPQQPFALHQLLYSSIYPHAETLPSPAWFPTNQLIEKTHIAECMREVGCTDYSAFHRWSVDHYADFWQLLITKLAIKFDHPYSEIIADKTKIETPNWLPEAKLNIVNSCLAANTNKTAIIYQTENHSIQKLTYGELKKLCNRVANSVSKHFKKGDAIGICMPMTPECVAIYLGIIKAGCTVVSIADSFSADEIALRLKITKAKGIFTQDEIIRSNKHLPLYARVMAAEPLLAIVVPADNQLAVSLRKEDLNFKDFLSPHEEFKAHSANPNEPINILFSSGTTGEPKAIPWTHVTAIKCASDAYLHQDIHPGEILTWPTNIGWMMGPWLIFASLINQGTIALFSGSPLERPFGEFIQNTKVNMLGLVPSLVKTWRATAGMEGLNWSAIKCFSSTGECSNAEDMLYLMSLAGYKPVIEYCGGTEIGGAYITSTLMQPNVPATFTTPALGLDFVMINESGELTSNGEVALIPPSMGLSNELYNKDHHEVYYANMPTLPNGKILRRHGDQIEKINPDYYRALGRVDDTMNLGAIKVSSAEIERALAVHNDVIETAAIAINPPEGGPSLLVIYAVVKNKNSTDKKTLQHELQKLIKEHLNPLFKIYDVVLIDSLPRTASNKVMRRLLRDEYTVRT